MSGATYWPESLVGKVRVQCVSLLVTVILTFGTEAPDGSVTVPTIVPLCPNASDGSSAEADTTINKYGSLNLVQNRKTLRTQFRASNNMSSTPFEMKSVLGPQPHPNTV